MKGGGRSADMWKERKRKGEIRIIIIIRISDAKSFESSVWLFAENFDLWNLSDLKKSPYKQTSFILSTKYNGTKEWNEKKRKRKRKRKWNYNQRDPDLSLRRTSSLSLSLSLCAWPSRQFLLFSFFFSPRFRRPRPSFQTVGGMSEETGGKREEKGNGANYRRYGN